MLHYFLRNHVKWLVYADKIETPGTSEENVRRIIAEVVEYWASRVEFILVNHGGHLAEISPNSSP